MIWRRQSTRAGSARAARSTDEEEHAATDRDPVLGDTQRGQSLAGSTRHDELAAIGDTEALTDGPQGIDLVRAEFLRSLEPQILRCSDRELRPVNARLIEILEPESRYRDLLILEGFLSVLAPVVGRGHDQPRPERLLAGRREERVDVLLLERVVGREELALDGRQVTGLSLPSHEVDSGVRLSVAVGPLHPEPNIAEPVSPDRIRPQVGAYQAFEAVALVLLILGRAEQLLQHAVDRPRHPYAPVPPCSEPAKNGQQPRTGRVPALSGAPPVFMVGWFSDTVRRLSSRWPLEGRA